MNVVQELEVAGSGQRVERKRAARRTRILEVALGLVAREGLAALTVQRLAAELDYTPGALYRYFVSKEALLAELQRHSLAAIDKRLDDRLASWRAASPVSEATPAVAVLLSLLGLARTYLRLPQTMPEHARLTTAFAGDPRPVVPDAEGLATAPLLVRIFGKVEGLFVTAAATGALTPGAARERAILYWAALQGVTQLDKLGRFDAELFQIERLGLSSARALLAGWGATAETLGEAERLLRSLTDLDGSQR